MSLFSSIILPQLEKELLALQPEVSNFILKQLKNVASEVIIWAESKMHIDINGDGVVGD